MHLVKTNDCSFKDGNSKDILCSVPFNQQQKVFYNSSHIDIINSCNVNRDVHSSGKTVGGNITSDILVKKSDCNYQGTPQNLSDSVKGDIDSSGKDTLHGRSRGIRESDINKRVVNKDILVKGSGNPQANTVLVKFDFCNFKNTHSIESWTPSFQQHHRPKARNIPYIHHILGAAKQVGVTFLANVPTGYITPKAHIPINVSPEAYLKAVTHISSSGKPNNQHCKIAIGSTFNIKLWQEKLKKL